MNTIGYAVVGCGHIAHKHIEAIRQVEGASLVAVCDTDPKRLQQFEARYGVAGYASLDDMLAQEPHIDVVNICTPSGYHKAVAIQAAECGKHVIVEKPIALTLSDADAIIDACQKHKVKLSVVHPNRFRPAMVVLKQLLGAGGLGRLSHVNATLRWNRGQSYYDQASWRGTKLLDGGVLMNQAIHNLDLLLWLFGPIQEVQAFKATRIRNIESEDVAVAVLKFCGGELGVIEAATTIHTENLEESVSVFGEKGSIVVGGKTANWFRHVDLEPSWKERLFEQLQQVERDPYGIPGHEQIIADMTEAIVSAREPVITGKDGREALRLVLAIYEAADLLRIVRLDHVLTTQH